MQNILGENGSLTAFLDFISPLLNVVYTVFSVELFGMPLWTVLLNFLVCFTVIGFITKGSVGIGGSLSSAVSRASSKRAEKNRKGKD